MTYEDAIINAFEDELQKIAVMKKEHLKTLGLVGAGAIGAESIRRAENDRRMGRAMRLQQGY